MKHIIFIFIAFLYLGINQSAFSQELKLFDPAKDANTKPKKTKQKLATEFYSAGEYEKALPLFEELYEENSGSYYYKYLLYCYLNLDEYKKAERLIKKSNKNNQKTYKELADLGYLQLQLGNVEKSEKLFESAIKELPADKAAVIDLANDFRSRGQTELAEQTYFKGRDLLNGQYQFNNELGYLYYYLEKYDKMTDAYLDLLAENPDQMRIVQYRIQNAYRKSTEDVVYPYLKDELLNRIKKEDAGGVYNELLLWLTIQRRDFKIAMIQAKALDKREGEEFFRVFDLGKIMLNNGDYKASIDAFNFILKQRNAKDLVIYQEVLQNLMTSRYQLLQSQNNPSKEEIDKLSTDFKKVLDELGRFSFTVPIEMDYAKLLFYYQDEKELAIHELDSLLQNRGLNKQAQASIKLLLGDFYLIDDNPWEATLLYSQVEKDFKNDPIGYESRLKNAKLSFYIGEFDWAKAQLDIIKGATDRKIANDAMNMSLLISENMDADSNYRALELYGKADLLLLQNQDSLALATLDSIFFISLYHELHDNVLFKQAQIYSDRKEYDKSIEKLVKIVDDFPDGLLADDAIWMMAKEFNHYKSPNEKNRLKTLLSNEYIFFYDIDINNYNVPEDYLYRKILIDYPSSIYVNEAREIYRNSEKEKAEPL